MHGRVDLIKYVTEVKVCRAFLHCWVGRRIQSCIIWKNAHLGFILLETKPKGANLHTWNYNPLYECKASDRVVHQILPSELPKQAHGIRLKFEPSRDDETTNIFK